MEILPNVLSVEDDEIQYLGSVCASCDDSDNEVQFLGSISSSCVRDQHSAGSSDFVVSTEVVVERVVERVLETRVSAPC